MNKVLKINITHTRVGNGKKIALTKGEKIFFTEFIHQGEKTYGTRKKLFVLKKGTKNELRFISFVLFEEGKKRYYFTYFGVKYFFESFDPFKAVLPPERTQKKKPVKK